MIKSLSAVESIQQLNKYQLFYDVNFLWSMLKSMIEIYQCWWPDARMNGGKKTDRTDSTGIIFSNKKFNQLISEKRGCGPLVLHLVFSASQMNFWTIFVIKLKGFFSTLGRGAGPPQFWKKNSYYFWVSQIDIFEKLLLLLSQPNSYSTGVNTNISKMLAHWQFFRNNKKNAYSKIIRSKNSFWGTQKNCHVGMCDRPTNDFKWRQEL